MNFKICLLVIATSLSVASQAQDKIYKKNGEVISASVKSIGARNITYVPFDNQSGPEYTVFRMEVKKIVYQDGSVDEFGLRITPRHYRANEADAAKNEGNLKDYGPAIIALAPLQFTENGLGISLSYERAIDKNGIVAFYLPVVATWNFNNNTYYNASTGTTQNGNDDLMVYAMPGIKIYPTGSYGIVKYAVGPSVVIGDGQKSNAVYDPISGSYTGQTIQQHFLLGIIVNNSLNINPTTHLYMGLDFGFGFTYLNRVGGLNQGSNGLVQGGFKIGYRF